MDTIRSFVQLLATSVAAYLLLLWAIQNAWTSRGNTKNILLLWDFFAYTTSGRIWSFVIWTLPRIIRWGSLVILVALVIGLFGWFSYLPEWMWRFLPQLLLFELAVLVGTLLHIKYWYDEGASATFGGVKLWWWIIKDL